MSLDRVPGGNSLLKLHLQRPQPSLNLLLKGGGLLDLLLQRPNPRLGLDLGGRRCRARDDRPGTARVVDR